MVFTSIQKNLLSLSTDLDKAIDSMYRTQKKINTSVTFEGTDRDQPKLSKKLSDTSKFGQDVRVFLLHDVPIASKFEKYLDDLAQTSALIQKIANEILPLKLSEPASSDLDAQEKEITTTQTTFATLSKKLLGQVS